MSLVTCSQCRPGGNMNRDSNVVFLSRTEEILSESEIYDDRGHIKHVGPVKIVTRVYMCSNGHEWTSRLFLQDGVRDNGCDKN